MVGFIAIGPLNYMPIFGAWGAPELGAEGCGLATAASMWISTPLFCFMSSQRALCSLICRTVGFRPDWGRISEIPQASGGADLLLETGVFSAITLLTTLATRRWPRIKSPSMFGTFSTFPWSALAGMATRMGHAIGARNAHSVRMALVGAALSTLIGLLAMSLLLLFPDAIIGAYTSPRTSGISRSGYCDWQRLPIMIDVVQIIGSLVLRAIRRRFPFIAVTLSYWGLALPLGYLLAIHWAVVI